MELVGPWEAVVADDDLRRSWLDEPDPVPLAADLDPAEATDGDEDGDDGIDPTPGDPDDGPTASTGPAPAWREVAVPGHWRTSPGFEAEDGPLLYRTRFELDPPSEDAERWWLRFDGVFSQGDVWLDGAYVGDTEGYFFPHTFEVTDAIRARRDHVLGIEVTSAPVRDQRAKRSITGSFQHAEGLPSDANPGGIWRPVRLERTGPVRIRHLRVLCREADATRAIVRFRAVLDAAEAVEATVRSTVGDVELVEERRLAAGENQVEWQIRVDEPALWWPHALGDQPLHDVIVEVATVSPVAAGAEAAAATPTVAAPPAQATGATERDVDGTAREAEGSVVSHRVERRIGLRQVHLRAWVLHVNGERLFLKGANQLPNRLDLASATAEDLRRDLELAKDAGLDLVRLHSHIGRPEVYDAADELGLLLWQDFPLHRSYARTIRKQAQRQAREAVDLLAHHPSVAIWCAHDEPSGGDDDPSAPPGVAAWAARELAGQAVPTWNRTILDRTVKRTIEKNDPTRPVIAHSGVLPHPPSFDGTDAHLGFGWLHGSSRDLAGLARAFPRIVRFVSQFGAASVPPEASFCEPERWPDLDWERLERDHGYRPEVFEARVPPLDHPSFESWRSATQELQATLVRRQVEILRRLKYRPTGGFAVFQLADGWPAIGWGLVDHERNPKPAYDALREACRPVIVVADLLPEVLLAGDLLALDVHVVSDRRERVPDLVVDAELRWEGGRQRWRFGGEVPADGCVRVGTLPVEVPDAPGPVELALTLTGPPAVDGPVHRLDRSRITAP